MHVCKHWNYSKIGKRHTKIPKSEPILPGKGVRVEQCFHAPKTKLVKRLEPWETLQSQGNGLKYWRVFAGLMAKFHGVSGALAAVTYDLSLTGLPAAIRPLCPAQQIDLRWRGQGQPAPDDLTAEGRKWKMREAQLNLWKIPWNRCAERGPSEGSRHRNPGPSHDHCSSRGLTPWILNQDLLSAQNDMTTLFLLRKHYVSNLSSRLEFFTIHTGS